MISTIESLTTNNKTLLSGLSTDTKILVYPEKPDLSLPNGTEMKEMDTGNTYILNSETKSWILQPKESSSGGVDKSYVDAADTALGVRVDDVTTSILDLASKTYVDTSVSNGITHMTTQLSSKADQLYVDDADLYLSNRIDALATRPDDFRDEANLPSEYPDREVVIFYSTVNYGEFAGCIVATFCVHNFVAVQALFKDDGVKIKYRLALAGATEWGRWEMITTH